MTGGNMAEAKSLKLDEVDNAERLRRGVGSWERLHAVIIGFALTSAVKAFADPWPKHAGLELLTSMKLHLLIAFVATLVPFFHGAQRHLEAVHLSSEVKPRPAIVFFDYMMMFLEGVFFSLLGMAVGNDRSFLHILTWLISIDLFWAGCSYVALKRNPVIVPWIILDLVSLALIALLWRSISADWWSVALAYGAVIRTIIDYGWNWDFYLDLARGKKVRPKRVAIESPLRGDEPTNKAFAEKVCKWVSDKGDSPYAMHLLFTRFLNESNPDERQQGTRGGLAWVAVADEVWFCLNSTSEPLKLSDGMMQALEFIEDLPCPPILRYFTFTQDGDPVAEYKSSSFQRKKVSGAALAG
jgi:hypothetical protein